LIDCIALIDLGLKALHLIFHPINLSTKLFDVLLILPPAAFVYGVARSPRGGQGMDSFICLYRHQRKQGNNIDLGLKALHLIFHPINLSTKLFHQSFTLRVCTSVALQNRRIDAWCVRACPGVVVAVAQASHVYEHVCVATRLVFDGPAFIGPYEKASCEARPTIIWY